MSGAVNREESWGSSVLRPQAYQDVGAVSWIRRQPYREPWKAATHAALCSFAVCCLALACTRIIYTREMALDARLTPSIDACGEDGRRDLVWLVPVAGDDRLGVRTGDRAAVVKAGGEHLDLGPIVRVGSGSRPCIGVQKPEQALGKRLRLRVETSRSLHGWVMHSIRNKSK